MKKRYRNENGQLTISFKEICKQTLEEAEKYFSIGCTYYKTSNKKEYVCIGNDGILIHFKSFDGENIFTPVENAGSFLPDVASEGMEMFIKFDTLEDVEKFIADHHYFPSFLYIGDIPFMRNELYKKSCNELYESDFGYSFHCTYGNYIDKNECYKVNGYNFLKNEYL